MKACALEAFTSLFFMILCLSCTNSNKEYSYIDSESPVEFPAPVMVSLDTCPEPEVTFLSSTPPPVVTAIGNPAARSTFNRNSASYRTGAPPRVIASGTPDANFHNYNTEHGLSLSSGTCSLKDRHGILWIGTRGGGLNRYDGRKFKYYTMTHGLPQDDIICMIEAQHGGLWIGTTGGGLSYFDGLEFTNYNTESGLVNDYVQCILEDTLGNLWIGTDGGANYFDGETFLTFTVEDGLPANSVTSIQRDADGLLWFATRSGLCTYNGQKFEQLSNFRGRAPVDINCMAFDSENNLWIGTTENGLFHLRDELFTNYSTNDGLLHPDVRDILEDEDGSLWIATFGGGVSRFDGQNFVNLTTNEGLAYDMVRSITMDDSGCLWAVTAGFGLSRYEGPGIISMNIEDGLPGSNIRKITEDRNGALWFGTANGGAAHYDGENFTLYGTVQGIGSEHVYSIIEDSKGRIWFGCLEGGVTCFEENVFTNFTADQGVVGDIIAIIEDSHENLWFATRSRGAIKFDGTSFTNYTIKQGLADNTIRSITEDPDGNIWFCTSDGISKFNGKVFTNYNSDHGLAGDLTSSMHIDRNGFVWIGTYDGGVSRFDGSGFRTFSTSNGLPNNHVYDIIEDNEGMIWIGTNLGIAALSFNAENASAQNIGAGLLDESNASLASYTPVWEVYNNNSGYPIKDVNSNAMCFARIGLPKGDSTSRHAIWSGCGDERVIRLNTRLDRHEPEPVPVFIENVTLNEENVCWYCLTPDANPTLALQQEMLSYGRVLLDHERENQSRSFDNISFDSLMTPGNLPVNLVLPYEFNHIGFEYVGVETGRPISVRYQYMLEGYDAEWWPPTSKTSVSYGNIREGSYTFRVRAQSPEGVWSSPREFRFRVLPPLHRTWWAYGLYSLLALFLMYQVHVYQKGRTIRKEREKTRQRELEQAREIEKAYTSLKEAQEQLIHSEKMASLGELTAGIAHEIRNPLNFVVNFSEINKELLDELDQEFGDRNNSAAGDIFQSLKHNEEKIAHHSKRAEAIVMAMLQHSRGGAGVKEPTEINTLVDEYTRLAYHGLRAKDKSFNARIDTALAPDTGKLNIAPQEIGKVVLNLVTNAFHAVAEKQDLSTEEYEPSVTVSTNRHDHVVEISVSDNGNGIPDDIVGKIFQPFFTTKSVRRGTGLGLSLSYDIVKAHGGQLRVETAVGEGSTFTVSLPA